MKKIDEMTKGYLECALWSSCSDDGRPLDDDHGIDDIADEDIEQAEKDCASFMERCRDDLEDLGLDDSQIGHDFWLTRNGHGAGFWCRGLGDVGEKLTEVCKEYGEKNPYVGDDGLIYIS